MNKKRVIMIVITIICLIIAFVFTVKAINISKANNITSYLCEKYKWEEKDIEILNYQKGYWDYNIGFMDDSIYFNYINPKWEIKYKDRVFNAEYYHFHFADDYQLEDIFEWCTEYLQENVDSEIGGMEVYSDLIYHSPEHDYDYGLPWNYKKVFTKNDSKTILNYLTDYYELVVFYKNKNLSYYGDAYTANNNYECYRANKMYYDYRNEKKELLNNKFDIKKDSLIVITNDDTFVRTDAHLFSYGWKQLAITIEFKTEGNYIFEKE